MLCAAWSGRMVFMIFAGTPTATEPSGMTIPSGTSAPAPMMQFRPMTQWLSRVACIPMRLPSPTVQP